MMKRRSFMQAGAALAAGPARGAAARRLVVAELFTSQGCSSCPPADTLLSELAQTRADVLPLAFHVTYWDGGGWRDPFSLDAATARQRRYARVLGLDAIYTPQLIVAGRQDVIGSDRAAVFGALAAAPALPIGLSVSRAAGQVVVSVAAGPGAGSVVVIGYDRQHRTAIGRGENGGRTLLESNIVRAVTMAGDWTGAALDLRVPTPPGEGLAVLLQAADGAMLGAIREEG